MKTKRYSGAQVVRTLQEVDSGKPVIIAAWDYGVLRATIHRSKARYGGMALIELRQLKALEEENARLKRMVVNGTNILLQEPQRNWYRDRHT